MTTCDMKMYVLDAWGHRVSYVCNRNKNHDGYHHGKRPDDKGEGRLPYTIKFGGTPYYYEDNVAENTQEA